MISITLAWAIALSAATPQLPNDVIKVSDLEIRGVLGDQPVDVKGILRLSAIQDVVVSVLPAVLETTSHDTIPLSAITAPADVTVKKNQPKDLVIQIDGIAKPGQYTGEFDVYISDPKKPDDPSRQQKLRVTVNVSTTPKLALVGAPPAWTVVSCANRFTCWLAKTLVPVAMSGEQRDFIVEDQRRTRPTLQGHLYSTSTNGISMTAGVAFTELATPTPASQYRASVTFEPAKLHAGVYPTVVRITPQNGGEPLSQAVTLDIRSAPWLALLAIVAGIIVGRLSQKLSTPLVQFQSASLGRVHQIAAQAEHIVDTALATVIQDRLANMLERIELATSADAALTAEIDKLAAQVVASLRFDRIAAAVADLEPERREKLEERLTAVRPSMLNGPLADAEKELATLEAEVHVPSDAPRPPLVAALRQRRQIVEPAETPAPWSITAWAGNAATRAVQVLAGTRSPSRRAQSRFLRPLLFVVLLVVLCLIGFNTLYIKAPAGFGSAGLFDLLGLFMWGLTAEVVQGSLQKLPA